MIKRVDYDFQPELFGLEELERVEDAAGKPIDDHSE